MSMSEEQLDVMKLREALAMILGMSQDSGSGSSFDANPAVKLIRIHSLAKRALNGTL